ncbi:hypothetical protein A1D23_10875 [Chelonobacter oris]|uniref:LysR family transcriptional regulator n=1 Tax=Chelonobacter oris TaxID=505317 RepID=UPI00244961AB|nr:LysR family transcriptional regulator [Chelonobacter oris]MDH3000957.1 hypothetical protein [Chelonobacter oris]
MLNKPEALRIFCTAAETLQFNEAAVRLGVAAPIVSRTIRRLERELGEILFQRNTRQIKLTRYGEYFYPLARQWLSDGEALFQAAQTPLQGEMRGVVRVALPRFIQNEALLQAVLSRLDDYPDIVLDWRVSEAHVNIVDARIDVGIRISSMPDNRLVVRPIMPMGAQVVAAPSLLAQWGEPKDLHDLQQRFPLSGLINPHTGRMWQWQFADGAAFLPKNPRFITANAEAEVAAALGGRVFAHLADHLAMPYIKRGELVPVLNRYKAEPWQLYVYRPSATLLPARVKLVFDILADILRKEFL